MCKKTNNKGFTLIEIVLVLAIIAMISSFSVVVYGSYQNKHDLDISTYTTAHYLREAYLQAKSSQNDDSWSVNLSESQLTLYKGTNFDTRNSDFDQIYELPEIMNISGITDVTFTKDSGLSSTTGTITYSIHKDSSTITINELGFIDY